MLKRARLTSKIVAAIVITLVLTSAVSFWITQRRVNQQAEEAFRDKVRQISGMAAATRDWSSNNSEVLGITKQYAADQHMTFRMPSLHPRDAKDQPNEFERRALEAFEKDFALPEYYERVVEDGRDTMHYARAVRLTEDCLACHGEPAGEKDPFGYAKEGLKAGDLRGAFVVNASTEGLVQTARSNWSALFLTSFLTLLTSAGVLFVLVRKLVTKPLSSAVDLANKIANNNLTAEDLPVESQDEIGEATSALNTMKNNLRKTVQAIAETAGHVATASEGLTATSQQISANSEETSVQANVVSTTTQQVNQNLQSVSTGAEEMTATIQSIASNAHEAATVASNAVQTAQAANATVGKLGDSSAEIGEVIEVITSIAHQTNLLALNATIQAAHAGEAGKGFAVVANEVKELAKRTAKATEDISRKINAIQQDTKGAVDAIGTISQVITTINDISGTIATAVEEQSATTNEMMRNVADAAKGSGEITNNIAGVAEAARGTSSSAQESRKAATELAEMAVQLQSLVAQFKIGDTGSGDRELRPNQSRSRAAHA